MMRALDIFFYTLAGALIVALAAGAGLALHTLSLTHGR
jgi:hypothetical protein